MGFDKVKLPSGSDVADFRKAVLKENADLADIPPRNVKVYKNQAAFENKATVAHLEEDSSIAVLGDSKPNALVVLVPTTETQGGNEAQKRTFDDLTERVTAALTEVMKPVNKSLLEIRTTETQGGNEAQKRTFDDLTERVTAAVGEGMKPVNKSLLEIREAFMQSKTASMSGVGDDTLNQILAYFQLKRTTAEIDFDDFALDRSDVYQWRTDEFGNLENENSDANREGYLTFLAGVLFSKGFGRFSIHDVDKLKGLTLNLPSKCFKGDGDVVISKKSSRNDAYCNGILNFELKKTEGLCVENRPQAIIQLLAFDDISIYKPVIVVLSDLNDYWELFWIEKPNIVRNQHITRNEALGYLKWHLGKFEEIIRSDTFQVGSSNTSDNEDNGKAGNKRTKFFTFPAYKATKYSDLTIKGKQRETFGDVGQLNDFPEVREEEKSRQAFKRMITGYSCKMGVLDADVVSLIRQDNELTELTMINYNLERWKADDVSDFESPDEADAIPQETIDIFDLP